MDPQNTQPIPTIPKTQPNISNATDDIDKDKSDVISQAVSVVTKTNAGIDIVTRTIVTLALVALLVFIMWPNGFTPIGIGIIVIIISIYILMILIDKDILSTKFKRPSINTQSVNANISVSTDNSEKIIDHISGILKTGAELRGLFPILGVREAENPENALIITDKHLDFIYVPLPGADKIVGGADVGTVDWILAKGDIENELNKMLNTMGLAQTLNSNPNNFSIDIKDVDKISTSDFENEINFHTISKQNYSYRIRDKGDFVRLKGLFKIS